MYITISYALPQRYQYQGTIRTDHSRNRKSPLLLVLLLIRLLSLHDPITMMFSILLLSLFSLHRLLHLKLIRNIATFLNRGPLIDRIQPLLQLRKSLGLHPGPLRPIHPTETSQIRDREFPSHEP